MLRSPERARVDCDSVIEYEIRQANPDDCAEIVRLTDQLGYPTSFDAMGGRLGRLLSSSTDVVFVAASLESHLLGWIHGALSQYLEADFRVEIAGLIIDEHFHRQGIGRALIGRLETWARERGAVQASVRCRTTRPQAHRFYESLGYSTNKTQIVFRKKL